MKRLLLASVLVCLALSGAPLHRAQARLIRQDNSGTGVDARSAQVDALMAAVVKENSPGAAVMVIRDGKVLHSKGYGLARLDTKEPVGTGTAFELSSTSKPFTALAAMLLVRQGKLSLDDPLSKFFPAFPAYAKKITVRHLLNHTSGLVDALDPKWFRKGYEPTAKDFAVMMAKEKTVRSEPGEKFEYNNAGYVLLALIVEKASGQPFARFMKESIFKPLGMNDTFIYDESKPSAARMAVSYFFEDNQFKPYLPTSDTFLYGAKGVVSTLEDMYRWEMAIESGKLLEPSLLKQTFTPARLTNGMETTYGFGWYVYKDNGLDVYEHPGGYYAYRANIRRYPGLRTTVILLSNNALVEPVQLARKIAQIYVGDAAAQSAAAAVEISEAILKEYAGKYEGDPSVMPNLIIEVTLEGNELYITSPIKPKTKLIAQSATEFQIAETASTVTFKRDDKGTVAGLTLKTRRGLVEAKKLQPSQ
ncbi:MAG TPA: serine hydrolase [Pyrinomonadaceae bacterium]|nr:serine hydrolase [Pyrinomonadaceae bacterium]